MYSNQDVTSLVMCNLLAGVISDEMRSNYFFIAGTLVLTANGYVPIEEIESGDRVFAENPETGEKGIRTVVQTFVNETDELVHISVKDTEITTTPEHPFYVPQKGWTWAIHLRAGDMLVLSNGEYVVVEKIEHELLESPALVYNFEVEDFHTYYVSAYGVLVHNTCIVRDNGVKIESYYPKDHAPAHLHVSGSGPKVKIGIVDGKLQSIKGILTSKQLRVVNKHSKVLIDF